MRWALILGLAAFALASMPAHAQACDAVIAARASADGILSVAVPEQPNVSPGCVLRVFNPSFDRGAVIANDPGCAPFNHILWPRQGCTIGIVDDKWVALHSPGRWQPPHAITFHIDEQSGSDPANDCLGTGMGACKTPNAAAKLLCQNIDNVAGAYIVWDTRTTDNFIGCRYVGPGEVVVDLNGRGIVGQNLPGGAMIGISNGGTWIIRNVYLHARSAGLIGILCAVGARCILGTGKNVFVGTGDPDNIAGDMITALYSGTNFRCMSDITIEGNWNSALAAYDAGHIECHAHKVTFDQTLGPPLIKAVALAHGGGATVSLAVKWSGIVAKGTKKYQIELGGLVDTPDCSEIPGEPVPTVGRFGLGCNFQH